MHAQLTNYELLPNKTDEAIGERIQARLVAIPGLKEYINLSAHDGTTGTVITIYENKKAADAAAPRIEEMWEQLAGMLSAPPVAKEYQVSTHVAGDAIRLLNEPGRSLPSG